MLASAPIMCAVALVNPPSTICLAICDYKLILCVDSAYTPENREKIIDMTTRMFLVT